MTKGRVNSEGSMRTAARTFREAGNSWAAVERAARRDENGVYVVRSSDLAEARRERTAAREPRR
jgi:hypothetical protein